MNKLKYFLDKLHTSSLEFCINKIKKLKKNELEIFWVTDDYFLDFPNKINIISISDQESEVYCYPIFITKDKTWLYLEQFDHFEHDLEYLKRNIDPMIAMKEMYILLDPKSKIIEETKTILEYLEVRFENEGHSIKQQVPRKLLNQFEILPEYKKL